MKKTVAAQYFLWWFAWGGFSAMMVLIVIKGGGLEFWQQLAFVVGTGVISGLCALCYYLRFFSK
jgi:hypothetical protein